MKKLLLLSLFFIVKQLAAQPFTPDKYGYVKDPKFHKLIKEKGYELVTDFQKVESGNDSLYANVYINGEWKYINVYGDLKTTLFNYQKREQEYVIRDYSIDEIDDIDEVYESVPMPSIENSKPYSEYEITKPGGKKWGTVHYKTKKQGLPYIYDRISYINPTIVAIHQEKKVGIAYSAGKVLIAPKYESLWSLYGRDDNRLLLIAKENNKYGVIDAEGKIIVPIIYDQLHKCVGCGNGLITVKQNNKWGLITPDNKQILPTTYNEIRRLTRNVIQVRPNEVRRFGLIDSLGNFIVDTMQTHIGVERYGIHYRNGNLVGLLNLNGEVILPQEYSKIEHRDNRNLLVKKGNKYGLLNAKAEEIIPIQYSYLSTYTKKKFIMARDTLGKVGILDFDNKTKIKFLYDELAIFDDTRYFYKRDGKYGIMDNKEKVLKTFKYSKMRKEGDFFLVEENNKQGIIDIEGNILLPIKYFYIKDPHDLYQHGHCKVRINGKYYHVDRYGNETLIRRY
jgi:hypothetical protein